MPSYKSLQMSDNVTVLYIQAQKITPVWCCPATNICNWFDPLKCFFFFHVSFIILCVYFSYHIPTEQIWCFCLWLNICQLFSVTLMLCLTASKMNQRFSWKLHTHIQNEFLHLKKAVTKIILEISYDQNMITVRYTVENSNAARRSTIESRICWIFFQNGEYCL